MNVALNLKTGETRTTFDVEASFIPEHVLGIVGRVKEDDDGDVETELSFAWHGGFDGRLNLLREVLLSLGKSRAEWVARAVLAELADTEGGAS